MSNPLLQNLEEKINNTLEVIELLRLQVEEFEEKNNQLTAENLALKNRQTEWEHNLTAMLRKLDDAHLQPQKRETSNASKEESPLDEFETA